MQERLQKILSQWGIASRRHAEEMIELGRVRRNGAIAQLGDKADPEHDVIEIDGKLIKPSHRPQHVYLLLNKPIGFVSTCFDPQGRSTVIDLLPPALREVGIHPVGRLDLASTGALLLTNDGELTFGMTHPRHSISKTYHVSVKGHPPQSVLQQWRDGVVLEGRKTRAAQLKVLSRSSTQTCLEIILQEGRNRQIRKIAAQLGYPVISLHRTAIGSIQLQPPGQPPLPQGSYRKLKDEEIRFLQGHRSPATSRRSLR